MFGKKKEPLFGSEVEPKCEYCLNFNDDEEGKTCRLGCESPSCGHFSYDPLLRTPSVTPKLKRHDPDEFKI